MNLEKKSWFTLVEIIVSITILIILWTIAFYSYESYSVWARDWTRITDMNNISKWLLLYQSKNSIFPIPEAYSTLTASWKEIRFQWIAWKSVLYNAWISSIDQWNWKDPLSWKYYTLIVDWGKRQYNLIGLLEKWDWISYINWINKAFTNSNEWTIMKIFWNDLGIIYDNNESIHEKYEFWIIIDILHTNNVFTIKYYSWDEITWTWNQLFTAYYNRDKYLLLDKEIAKWDNSLVWYWDMVSTSKSWSLIVMKDFSNNNNNWVCYNWVNIVDCWWTIWPSIREWVMIFDWVNDYVQINKNVYSNVITTTIRVKPVILDGTWHWFFWYQSPIPETVPPYNNPSSLRPFNLRLAPNNLTLNWWFHYDSHDITATSLSNAHLTWRRCQDNKEYVYNKNETQKRDFFIGYRRNPPYVNLDINWNSFVRRDCRVRSATDPATPQINTFNTFHTNFNYLRIGRVDNYFMWSIDEVRVYNRNLTDMEVNTIFESLNIEDKLANN